jgi:hypothetical protein
MKTAPWVTWETLIYRFARTGGGLAAAASRETINQNSGQ